MRLVCDDDVVENLLIGIGLDCNEAVEVRHEAHDGHHPKVHAFIVLREALHRVGNAQPNRHLENYHAYKRVEEHHRKEWAKNEGHQIDDVHLSVHVIQVEIIASVQLFVRLDRLLAGLDW